MRIFKPRETESKFSKIARWLLLGLTIFFVIVIIFSSLVAAYSYKNRNNIFPGVSVADIELGGLTKSQAQTVIIEKFQQNFQNGFNFTFNTVRKKINNDNTAIFSLNTESLVNTAFNQGRNKHPIINHLEVLLFPLFKRTIPLDYKFDKAQLQEKLKQEFTALEQPVKQTELQIEILDQSTGSYDLSLSEPASGKTFLYGQAINQLQNSLEDLENPTIELTQTIEHPKVTVDEAEKMLQQVKEILNLHTVKLTYEDNEWEILWTDYGQWLTFDLADNNVATLSFNPEMVNVQLTAMAQEINSEPINAKLQMLDGKVTEFQASKPGRNLDFEKNHEQLVRQITQNLQNQIELIVDIKNPEISVGNTNELGIQEIIGVGWSNFWGSPYNRRHNIGVGAATLNGVLVAPEEEFKLVPTLGKIDAAHGYRPELVIKENSTVPEYGGGLCQIATTIFRAALDAGLKITARKNHSYRVGYYEPAGTDATIYSPQPDFRFINDTNNYILIQTKIQGYDLTFEIWGTHDGREVTFEGQKNVDNVKDLVPHIFNITAPGPPKEIETTELEPGKRRQEETAHYGASTWFKRFIKRPGQTENEEETFSSHYVPWQAVFLVGVDPEAKEKQAQEDLAEESATNQDDSTENNANSDEINE